MTASHGYVSERATLQLPAKTRLVLRGCTPDPDCAVYRSTQRSQHIGTIARTQSTSGFVKCVSVGSVVMEVEECHTLGAY